jgi:hypothetical protein
MVRELLRRGADPTLRDRSYDGTALNWAQHGAEHGWHSKTGTYSATIEALTTENGEMGSKQ